MLQKYNIAVNTEPVRRGAAALLGGWDRESRVQFFRRCLIGEFTGKRNTQEKNVSNNRKNLLYYLELSHRRNSPAQKPRILAAD